jgi:hypothetical protein
VTWPEIQTLILGAVEGVGSGLAFILVLFIGISVGLGFSKLRPSGPGTLTVRSLDEALGTPNTYLPPTAPRGPSDQLAGSQVKGTALRFDS